MRETPRSLRAYFILVGLLTLAGSLFALSDLRFVGYGITSVILLLQAGMGAAYVYVGVRLLDLLRDKPQLPLKFAMAAILLSCLRINVIGILLNVYIYYQLKRMARDAAPEMESQVLE